TRRPVTPTRPSTAAMGAAGREDRAFCAVVARELFIGDAELRFLRLIEAVPETGIPCIDNTVGVEVGIRAHTRLLTGGTTLAGAVAVAIVVHAIIADAGAGIRDIVAAGFLVFVSAAIQRQGVV